MNKISTAVSSASKYEEIKTIMSKLIISLHTGSRDVTYCNTQVMIEYFYDRKTVNKTKAKRQLRTLIGLSQRYVTEILDSLIAWDILREIDGNVVYIGLNSTEIDFSVIPEPKIIDNEITDSNGNVIYTRDDSHE